MLPSKAGALRRFDKIEKKTCQHMPAVSTATEQQLRGKKWCAHLKDGIQHTDGTIWMLFTGRLALTQTSNVQVASEAVSGSKPIIVQVHDLNDRFYLGFGDE